MGQKANPNGMRVGIVREWKSRYYPSKNADWANFIVQDKKIRKYFDTYLKSWSLSSVDIERSGNILTIIIFTAKPGMVLGQEGSNIKKVEKALARLLKDKTIKLSIEIKEVKNPDLDATIVANEIAASLERRVPFRIAQKKAIRRTMKSGAKGIKTQVSGRLNGVDMARTEGYLEGQVPLQTLRNDIDYSRAIAKTTYGILGVKVWISRGEKLNLSSKREKEIKDNSFNKRPYVKKGGN